jgi:hypothetical protein
VVERVLPKHDIVGSNPIARSKNHQSKISGGSFSIARRTGEMAMITTQVSTPKGLLEPQSIYATLFSGLAGKFSRQKVLVLIPDHTRSLPLPELFRMVVEILRDVRQLDFIVALGTLSPRQCTSQNLLSLSVAR